MKGKLFSLLITQDTSFDLNDLTGSKGAIDLSIRNIGQADLIIDDATQERILPQESFVVDNTIAIVNTDFRVKFDKKGNQSTLAIIRYIVVVD